jgi:hypothetical protein
MSDTSIRVETITTGGQSGAEEAARQIAISFRVPTVGWTVESSPAELRSAPTAGAGTAQPKPPEDSALSPTEKNVRDSDGTLWFGDTTTAHAQATVRACHRFGKPCMPVYPAAEFRPSHVATWIQENKIKNLNVTGNREDHEPGIGDRVKLVLHGVLQQFGHKKSD